MLNEYPTLARKHPGKRAFITGAGSGLGLAFATELSRNGWHVAITDVNEEALKTAASAVANAGVTPITYAFDVADYQSFSEAVSDFVSKTGGIDIGINNAGIGCGGKLHELPVETFRRVIDVNLMGVVNGCHLFIPVMKQQQSGHILNVASAAAFAAAPRMSAYSTSKAGVVALSECLHGELVADGVLVTVLLPTYVRTRIGVDALGTAADKKFAEILVDRSQLMPEEVVRKTLAKMEHEELYVVLPSDARNMWRFKRYFPNKFRRFVNVESERLIAKHCQTDDA